MPELKQKHIPLTVTKVCICKHIVNSIQEAQCNNFNLADSVTNIVEIKKNNQCINNKIGVYYTILAIFLVVVGFVHCVLS